MNVNQQKGRNQQGVGHDDVERPKNLPLEEDETPA